MRTPIPSPVTVEPPQGWTLSPLHDPFEAHVGPLFEREEDGERIFGFFADKRHLDDRGAVHEGMLMTFADAFLGTTAHRGSNGKGCVTVSLQASFLAEAKAGDFIECRTHIDRTTRAIIFVSARFSVGEEDVMTATSLWKVLGER
ncbi:PaaI family thioesterase [Parvibaculum sp.]|uniref:PaaI family thioesterase n=1 Tax=Parvibaculum sp. TaxID=2024848 RepID=UPI0025E180FB|nr:PaaI family thioesterase [Parvibaculum sp.]